MINLTDKDALVKRGFIVSEKTLLADGIVSVLIGKVLAESDH